VDWTSDHRKLTVGNAEFASVENVGMEFVAYNYIYQVNKL